jgi:hypothetical protein
MRIGLSRLRYDKFIGYFKGSIAYFISINTADFSTVFGTVSFSMVHEITHVSIFLSPFMCSSSTAFIQSRFIDNGIVLQGCW